jgi:hypothetical protein
MGQEMTPDRKEAEQFLDLLAEGSKFWFQTACEAKDQPRRGGQAMNGTLESCWDRLVELNMGGSAVWVQINDGTSRKAADVTAIRAYFVDIDTGDGSLLLNAAIPADIVVESSPGKYHGYWLTGNAPLEQFRARQRALAEALGGDLAVSDLSRVMRLPGFFHQKSAPFQSRIFRIREGL